MIPRPALYRSLAIALLAMIVLAPSLAAQDGDVTPPEDGPRLSLTLDERNDSGISGTVTLYAADDRTIVDIRVDDAGASHPAHIHPGTCDDLDPTPAYELENVVEGRSTTLVDATLDDLLAGDFAVDMHLSDAELGTLIACADIEGEPTGGTATDEPTPTETATPTESATPDAVGGSGIAAGDGTGGAQQMSEDIASLPLQELDGNGITGVVQITRIGAGETDIIVQLTGDSVTGNHPVHLHVGTDCDALVDEGTIDLEPIDDGGLSETVVDIDFDALLGDGYALNVHQSEDDYGTVLACGVFDDATVGAVVPEVAPPTGAGPATATPEASGGNGIDVLPERAGSGTSLFGPGLDPVVLYAAIAGGMLLAISAIVIRRGERANHIQRWRRLGL